MSGFTPGPWLLDGSTVYAIDPEARVNRFSVMANAGHAGRERTSDAELLANARLIASAPDLLAALEAAMIAANELGVSSAHFPRPQILAALAKASPSARMLECEK